MKFDKDYRNKKLHCVVKFSLGRKFIILKCKNLDSTIKSILRQYRAYSRGGKLEKGNLYYHFFKHADKYKKDMVVVDILFEHESPYEILVEELEWLKESIVKKDGKTPNQNCLNNNVEPYVPDYDKDTQDYNWISKGDLLNYTNYKKKHYK